MSYFGSDPFDPYEPPRRYLVALAAGAPVLTLSEIKQHLRVDHNDDDVLIEQLAAAAQATIEGQDGSLGIALLTQRWKLVVERFWNCQPWRLTPLRRSDEIVLPYPPLISVQEVKYLDGNGTLQTLDAALYRLIKRGTKPSSLLPAIGHTWPVAICDPEAVQISFTAGFDGAGMVPGTVPDKIKHALKLIVGHLYVNREAVTDGRANAQYVTPMGVDFLLANHRVTWF